MRQLSSLDSQLLAVEERPTHGHVGALGVFAAASCCVTRRHPDRLTQQEA